MAECCFTCERYVKTDLSRSVVVALKVAWLCGLG